MAAAALLLVRPVAVAGCVGRMWAEALPLLQQQWLLLCVSKKEAQLLYVLKEALKLCVSKEAQQQLVLEGVSEASAHVKESWEGV